MMTRPIDVTVWLLTLLGTCYSVALYGACNDADTCTTSGQSCPRVFSNCVHYGRCEWNKKYNTEACVDSNQCQGGTTCTSGTCSCATGTYNTALKMCTALKAIGQMCTVNADCFQGTLEAECSTTTNVCTCKSGYIKDANINMCRPPLPSEACSSAKGAPSCINQGVVEFENVSATCSSGYCTCPTGSTAKTFSDPENRGYKLCYTDVTMLVDGAVCTTHNQCSSCTCVACPGTTSTTCVTVAGVAGTKKYNTEACVDSSQCQGGTTCSSSTCSCASGTYNTVLKMCTTLREYGQACTASTECYQGGTGGEAECSTTTNVCTCKIGYIKDANVNMCRPPDVTMLADGAVCTTQSQCSSGWCMACPGSTSTTCVTGAWNQSTCTTQPPASTLPNANTTTAAPPHERSDIRCEADAIVIFLPDTLIPAGRNVTWREERCGVSYNGSHYVDTVKLNDCGTTVQIDTNTVTFYNELIVHRGANRTHGGHNSDITYGDDYETVVPVKCIYPRLNNVSTSYSPVKQHVRFFEKRYGDLDLEMIQYETGQFRTPVPSTSYPRIVPLDDDIFIRIGLNFDTRDIGVKVDHCIATSTASPADANWHSLIQSGCPDQNVRLLSASGHSDVKFAFKAFDFRMHSTGYIYVHCEVSVCGGANTSCAMGCPPRARRAAADDAYGGSRLVTAGPLLVEKRDAKESAGAAVSMTTVFAGVCLCVAMVAVVVAVIGWKRKPRK